MNKIGSVILGLLVILSSSCGNEPPPMKKEILVKTLVDVHIAEGLTNSHHPIALRDSLHPLYVSQVLKVNGITQEQFEEAMTYMHSHPTYMDIIYLDVLDELAKMSQLLDDEEQRKRDLEYDDGVDKKPKSTNDSEN